MSPQPVTFPCPFCTRRMGVPAELLGRQVRCPHCKQVIVAPVNAAIPSAPPPPVPAPVIVPPEPELRAFNIPSKKEGADSILSEPDESDDEVFGSKPSARQNTFPVGPLPPAPPEPDTAPAPIPDDPFGFGPGPKPPAPAQVPQPLVTATVFDLPPNVIPAPAPKPAPVPAPAAATQLPDPFGDFGTEATTPSLPQKPTPPAAKPQPAPPVPRPVAPAPAPVAAGSNPFADFETDPSTVPVQMPVKMVKPPVEASVTEVLPDEVPVQPRKMPRDEEREEKPARAGRGRPAPSDGGGLKTVALIALGGYALVITALAVYGLFFKSGGSDVHPLSTIPDNFGEFDPVSRKKVSKLNVPADGELPAAQRAPLGGKVTIGQLEVQPVRVEKRALLIGIEGRDERERPIVEKTAPALVLTLDIKNTGDLPIFPMDPAFTRLAIKNDQPLTRLAIGPKVYAGGQIEWPLDSKYKKKMEKQQANDSIPLKPNESREYVVFTPGNLELVRSAEASKESLQWRVQVRRGLVEYKGKEVPVTAVIGVDFKGSDIRLPQGTS